MDIFYDANETLSEYDFESSVRIEDVSDDTASSSGEDTNRGEQEVDSKLGVPAVMQEQVENGKLTPRSQRKSPKYRYVMIASFHLV